MEFKACEGIEGNKTRRWRSPNTWAKEAKPQNGCSCKKERLMIGLDWIGMGRTVEVKLIFISVAFTVPPQLSLGPTDWWIGLSIGQPGEDVRCVF